MVSTNQINKIHKLLTQMDIVEEELLVMGKFTAAEHVSEMTTKEADNMIKFLIKEHPVAVSMDKMRKKMLSYGYEMGWQNPTTGAEEALTPTKINVLHVDNWCESSKSKYKKPLNKLSYSELEKTVSQFEQLYKKHLQKS